MEGVGTSQEEGFYWLTGVDGTQDFELLGSIDT